MRLIDWANKLSRRGFLAGGAATIAAVAVSGGASILADAQAPPGAAAVGLNAEDLRSLLIFTRDLFPHDHLEDEFYLNAIAPLKEEASKDPAAQKMLAEGIAQLNAATMKSAGKLYTNITDENVRIVAIKQIEGGPFFAKVYNGTMAPLYNQPALWPKFGYEGPSSAKGGYIDRGFSDIDWL